MYGFGDDKNPANDTVNVMEEILLEYITDVVRLHIISLRIARSVISNYSASQPVAHPRSQGFQLTIYGAYCRDLKMRRSWRVWRNCCSCKKTSSEPVLSSRTLTTLGQRNLSRVACTLYSSRTYCTIDHGTIILP